MPRWLSRTALLLCLFGLVAYAYAPLVEAGFLGRDVTHLVDASRLAWPQDLERDGQRTADLLWARDGEIRPLSSLSLALSSRLWTEHGAWTQSGLVALRAEHMLYLLLSALALALCVQRVLLPWFGSEGAGAAARASALVLACHPLCTWVIFHPGARGDLLATLFGCSAAVLFLRGRQEREPAPVVIAAGCAVLCGFASDLAWFLPAALAALELSSARRYRALHVRLRTAATTFVVFTMCIAVERFTAVAVHAPASATDPWGDVVSLGSLVSWQRTIAKLACLVLPVSPAWSGATGFVLCGAMLLVALHPALVAARSAPKMWATLGLAWCAALFVFSFRRAATEIGPHDFSNAAVLFPGAVLMSAALGIASSALSGLRRGLVPLLVAACLALLAHGAASAFPAATKVIATLREDLLQARVLHGTDARILVIDPPERANGMEILGGCVPLLLDPALGTDERLGSSSATRAPRRTWVRSIELRALFALAREPEFAEMRRAKLVLVFPESLIRPDDLSASKRLSMRLSEPDASNPKIFWREKARSDLLDFDPLAVRFVRVLALSTASTAEAPELNWRSSAETFEYGARTGVWLRGAGTDGPSAMFDLSRSFAWLCGKRIRRLSFQQAPTQLVYTEGMEALPELKGAAAPRVNGDDWMMSVRTDALPQPAVGEGRCLLDLLDLAHFGFVEISAPMSATGELRIADAGAWEKSVLRAGGGPIAWTLIYRIGNTDVARSSGRRP